MIQREINFINQSKSIRTHTHIYRIENNWKYCNNNNTDRLCKPPLLSIIDTILLLQ